jgi:hypothetical protein
VHPRVIRDPEVDVTDEIADYVPNLRVPAMNAQDDRQQNYLGNLNDPEKYVLCRYCKAKHFYEEKLSCSTRKKLYFGTCCGKGAYVPAQLRGYPEFMKSIYLGSSVFSKKFF